jgi:menaquinone-9 beta-reductase
MKTAALQAQYDAIVVGARCAGAATALLLARAGARVLMVDRQEYGSDRLSTHAIMRGGVKQLRSWGLLGEILAAGTPAIRRTSFIYGEKTVAVEIKPEQGIDCLVAPRRTVLDRILADAARRAGAAVRHSVAITDLLWDGRQVTGVVARDAEGNSHGIKADIVIGADGRQSTVARLAGARIYRRGKHAAGSVYGYFEGIADTGTRWYFADRSAAGAIPTNHGRHCVFASAPVADFAAIFKRNMQDGLLAVAQANSPDLARELAAAHPAERLRGYIGEPGFFRTSHGPGWALVGDAGYFKDPLTAHGITDAFRDAGLLAKAVIAGGASALRRYQEQRDTLSAELFEVTDRIASFDWDMDIAQALHQRLSQAMKAECAFLDDAAAPPQLAA